MYHPSNVNEKDVNNTIKSIKYTSNSLEKVEKSKKRKKLTIEQLGMTSDPMSYYDILYKPVSPLLPNEIEEKQEIDNCQDEFDNELVECIDDSQSISIEETRVLASQSPISDVSESLSLELSSNVPIYPTHSKDLNVPEDLAESKEEQSLELDCQFNQVVDSIPNLIQSNSNENKRVQLKEKLNTEDDLSALLYDLI